MTKLAGSFRDPSGFIYKKDDMVLRQVNKTYQTHFDHLLSSGLYQTLVDEQLLLSFEQIEIGSALTPEAYTVLKPERIPFVSYPYEWCPSQLFR